ncbi:class I SAM-dependent methyltransferase [Parasynechococcus sp.]|uniref:class I SAM-dependent methyltransferase n=1 Tax=Parasynechococcus sp. TaxID=3101203 RepID=UPI0037047473
MRNVRIRQLDILDANQLEDIYDVIECSGVLHHMQNPAQGLEELNSKLKPGRYSSLACTANLPGRKSPQHKS